MPPVVGTIGAKVDVSLSVTVAGYAVNLARTYVDGWTAIKGIAGLSIIISTLSPPHGKTTGDDSVPRTLVNALETLQRLCIIALTRVVLEQLRPPVSQAGDSPYLLQDIDRYASAAAPTDVFSPFSRIPLDALPAVEVFIFSSLTIVLVASVVRIYSSRRHDAVDGSQQQQGMDNILSGVKYAFADSASGMILDSRIKHMLAFAGVVFLDRLSNASCDDSSDTDYSPTSFLKSGIAMAWVNLVVELVLPRGDSGAYSSVLQITAALCAALLISSMRRGGKGGGSGVSTIHGYLEWNVSNIVVGVLRAMPSGSGMGRGVGYVDTLVMGTTLYLLSGVCAGILFRRTSEAGGAMTTISDIFTLVLVNGTTAWLVSGVGGVSSAVGIISAVLIMVIAGGVERVSAFVGRSGVSK